MKFFDCEGVSFRNANEYFQHPNQGQVFLVTTEYGVKGAGMEYKKREVPKIAPLIPPIQPMTSARIVQDVIAM